MIKKQIKTHVAPGASEPPRESLKAEWITLFILIAVSAAVIAWSLDHFRELKPAAVSDKVRIDPDDPAIWIHPIDPSKSLVLGTDKGLLDGKRNGRLYVFDLNGAELRDKTVDKLQRPNNVDVAYGLMLDGKPTDIAVLTERLANRLRIYRLPDMTPVDGGGLTVFEGQPKSHRQPMGIGLYERPSDGSIYAVVSRKAGPSGSYLWQYQLSDDGTGQVTARKVREFGTFFNHGGEIEAIAVDDELGYIYYSDEYFGVRKYHADPDHPDAAKELGTLATEYFRRDREGIAIYHTDKARGYIIVSDQQANLFHIYTREGAPDNPHRHEKVKTVRLSTERTDGIDVVNLSFGGRYPGGLFVAMTDSKQFQFYSWATIAGDDLETAGN